METLLLLALGAWALTKYGGTSTTSPPPSGDDLPPQQPPRRRPGQPLPIELSYVRLPFTIINGKEFLATLPLPVNVIYKDVGCKEPGGTTRTIDIEAKYLEYRNAYNNWVSIGSPQNGLKGTKKARTIKALLDSKQAYISAVTLHLQSCRDYDKQFK